MCRCAFLLSEPLPVEPAKPVGGSFNIELELSIYPYLSLHPYLSLCLFIYLILSYLILSVCPYVSLSIYLPIYLLRLPQSFLTAHKGCAWHEVCTPRKHAAPATRSVLDLASVLRLSRNLYLSAVPGYLHLRLTLRSAAPATKSSADLAQSACDSPCQHCYRDAPAAKVLRPSRNLITNPTKCYVCHATCTSGC